MNEKVTVSVILLKKQSLSVQDLKQTLTGHVANNRVTIIYYMQDE